MEQQATSHRKQGAPDVTIVVHRVDLFDSGHSDDDRTHNMSTNPQPTQPLTMPVSHYHYVPPEKNLSKQEQDDANGKKKSFRIISSCRIPQQTHPSPVGRRILSFPVVDNTTPNPHGPSVEKYWQQRRRLFSRFDQGIQLDEQGWFSVTPEQIADHVACRLTELIMTQGAMLRMTAQRPVTVLDAFGGCGGNAIAFAKQPNIVVYAVDTDREKLRMAAHNAKIYGIPPQKLFLIECNALFVLEYCFRDGEFVLDQPIETPEQAEALMQSMPPPVPCEQCHGFTIGGIDNLPRNIDAVFMDPPWGGVDYEVFGKHGYYLERNMKIPRPAPPPPAGGGASESDFFDTFVSSPRSKQERMSQFNCGLDADNCVNGAELLALAAAATASRWVIYDVPRNTNHKSLGQAALEAGYRGNCKLEEHCLNRRLKTVTAYFGTDWSGLLEQNGTIYTNCWNE